MLYLVFITTIVSRIDDLEVLGYCEPRFAIDHAALVERFRSVVYNRYLPKYRIRRRLGPSYSVQKTKHP
jgi:hypothetical protein